MRAPVGWWLWFAVLVALWSSPLFQSLRGGAFYELSRVDAQMSLGLRATQQSTTRDIDGRPTPGRFERSPRQAIQKTAAVHDSDRRQTIPKNDEDESDTSHDAAKAHPRLADVQRLLNLPLNRLSGRHVRRGLRDLIRILEADPSTRSDCDALARDLILRAQAPSVLSELTAGDCASLFAHAARLVHPPPPRLTRLSARAVHCSGDLTAPQVRRILVAIATLRIENEALVRTLTARACVVLRDLSPSDLPSLLWSLSSLSHLDQTLMDLAAIQVMQNAHVYTAEDTVQILLVYGTLKAHHPRLTAALLHCLTVHDGALLASLEFPALADLVWTLAMMEHRTTLVLRLVSTEVIQRDLLATASTHHIAILLKAYATLETLDLPLLDAVAAAVVQRNLSFGPVATASALWACGRLNYRNPDLVAALTRDAAAAVSEISVGRLGDVTWALTRLQAGDAALLGAIVERIVLFRPRTKEHRFAEISRVLWAISSREIRNATLLHRLAGPLLAEGLLHHLDPHKVAQTAWSFSNLMFDNRPLFDALATQFERSPQTPGSLSIARMLSAFANLRYCAPKRFARWGRWLMASPEPVQPHWLPLVAQPYAVCDGLDSTLLTWLVRECKAPGVLEALPSHQLVALLGALSSAGIRDEDLTTLFVGRLMHPDILSTITAASMAKSSYVLLSAGVWVKPLLAVFAPRLQDPKTWEGADSSDVASIAWAFATAGVGDHSFLDDLAQVALRPVTLNSLTAWSLANLLWSFATLGYRHGELFDALADRAVLLLPNFTDQGIGNTLWSLAHVGYRHHRLLEAATQRLITAAEAFDSQTIVSSLWALTVLDVVDDTLFATLLPFVQRPDLDHVAHMSQMRQVLLHVHLNADRMPRTRKAVDAHFAVRAEAAFRTCKQISSAFQADVAALLRGMGAVIQEEVVLVQSGGYSVDIYCPAQRLVVEVDGPSHFYRDGATLRPVGATILKHRQLRGFGHPVFSVSYAWWDGKSLDERRRILRDGMLLALKTT